MSPYSLRVKKYDISYYIYIRGRQKIINNEYLLARLKKLIPDDFY